jgi:SAM-dependent methyltransferase
MQEAPQEKIELLSVELLEKHRHTVSRLKGLAHSLSLEFGWHYLLDMTWILEQLGSLAGKRIIDAGAGVGVLQWYLARDGAHVISVDRLSRADLPLRFRSRFHVQGLREQDLLSARQVFRESLTSQAPLSAKVSRQLREVRAMARFGKGAGKVFIYNQDLKDLADIDDDSIDAVVAVSALEHNSPEALELVVQELMRVLKPGGFLAASLNAAREEDWWHEPSSGWCYTDDSLRRLFCLPPDLPSNYDRYDELLAELRDCRELRDGLAAFYFRSGNNGMPWGKWSPQYIPVGVLKIKPPGHPTGGFITE